jgi:hypothetical protein
VRTFSTRRAEKVEAAAALLTERAFRGGPDGRRFRSWWTRLQPIRTVGEITARIPIKPTQQVPLYQRIARKVSQLRLLGMSYKQIGQALHVSPSLARKAHEFERKKP